MLQSGEGLSVLFVVIWLLGDLSSLTGAIVAGLLPTVIILAVYVRSLCLCIFKKLNEFLMTSIRRVIPFSSAKSIIIAGSDASERRTQALIVVCVKSWNLY